LRGMRIALGQRLSGWVAANLKTISNSDAALDLGDVVGGQAAKLKSCISTPLLANGVLVGVLTLYSAEPNGFTDNHRRIIEAIARQVAHAFKSGKQTEAVAATPNALAGLPDLNQLEQFVQAAGTHYLNQRSAFTLLLIDVIGLDQINLVQGEAAGGEVLRHVAYHATAGLRLADILFRYGSSEFVALLNDTTPETAAIVASRVREAIRGTPVILRNGTIPVDVSIANVTAAGDGTSLASLIDAARASK
jgi:diguanylate cyclase (GGDEF)-like protein